MARTWTPSAGAPSVLCSVLLPEFPAELTTTTPRAAAISAARVLMAVWPFMSRYV